MRFPTSWTRKRPRPVKKGKFEWLNSVWSPLIVALVTAAATGYFNVTATSDAFVNALKLERERDANAQQAELRRQSAEERAFKKRQIDDALLAYADIAAQSLQAEKDFLFDLGDRGWTPEAFKRYDAIDRALSTRAVSAAVKLATADPAMLELVSPLFYEQTVINSHLWVSRQWYQNDPSAAAKRYQSIGERANRIYQLIPRRLANVSAGKALNAGLPSEVLASIKLDDLIGELSNVSPQVQRLRPSRAGGPASTTFP